MSSQSVCTILVAVPNAALRSALCVLLEVEIGACDVETVADAETFLARAGQKPFALVLLDWRLPGMRPAPLLRVIRHMRPEVKVLVLSERAEDGIGARRIGADGFALKSEPPDRLIALIRELIAHVETSA